MSNNKKSCYQKYLSCAGDILGILCCSYKKIQTGHVGLIQKFGKFSQVSYPGLKYICPMTQKIIIISLQTKIINMSKQSIYTKDNINIIIDVSLFYRIINPFKSTYIVKDILSSIIQLTFVTLRTIFGQYTLQQILTKRKQINKKIQQFVKKQSQQWGVYVDYLLIKDLHLNKYLQQNLSKVSKTKKIVQSKIISARSDLQSAKLYRQAADILDLKAAIQIRFLQTLQQMNKYKSTKTIIMPLQSSYD